MKSVIGVDVPRDIVLGLWKISILQHASEGGVVGHQLLRELGRLGYDISPGTLYPTLHRMEQNGWLGSHARDGAPKAPRTYRITAAGIEILDRLQPIVDQLNRALSRKRKRKSPQQEGSHR